MLLKTGDSYITSQTEVPKDQRFLESKGSLNRKNSKIVKIHILPVNVKKMCGRKN